MTSDALDLTEDDHGEGPASIVDLTADPPRVLPDVVEHARADRVLDLTEDDPHLALPDLLDTPLGAIDPSTRAFLLLVFERLTPAEQAGLVREAQEGDRLAQHLLAALDAALRGPVLR
jgi:hypothetical protein